jgi:hypothetical protein
MLTPRRRRRRSAIAIKALRGADPWIRDQARDHVNRARHVQKSQTASGHQLQSSDVVHTR